MSISTKLGDDGSTSLPDGSRISKADIQVEAYGGVDELISSIGFARSICGERDLSQQLRAIQQDLFLLCSTIATIDPPDVPNDRVERLTNDVRRLEKQPGILADWSIPGEHPVAAALDVARATCRRVERTVVRLSQSGIALQRNVFAYLNRLSDWLWITARAIELQEGRDSSLRNKPGKRWSRAW